MIKITENLPEKAKDLVVIDSNGNKHWCYRCACKNEKCMEFRCPITGSMIMIDVIEWEYEDK
jgi:hypothetical protein